LSAEAKDWLPENLFRQAFGRSRSPGVVHAVSAAVFAALGGRKKCDIEQWAGRQRQIMDGGILPERFES